MLRKVLSLFLAISVLLSMMIFYSSVSTSALDESLCYEKKESQELVPTKADLELIIPVTVNNVTTYYDSNNNVVDITKYNSASTVDETALPKSFDLRDEGRVTSVKDQGSEGFCWNFASTASMESSILSTPELRAALGENGAEILDLSEVGNTWYIHTSIDDETSYLYGDYIEDGSKGAMGGGPDIVVQGLSSGFGAYPEELMPYSSWGTGYSEALRFYSDYRLKEYVVLENDGAIVKDRLMEYGAIYLSYPNFPSNYYLGEDSMQAYYTDGNPINSYDDLSASHAVTLVGWDDDFSKDNFAPEMQPENDGAWLIKNSWGEHDGSQAEGYEGYFWMSYESEISDLAQYTMQSVDEFDNIYQHQFTNSAAAEVVSAANVFTAESDEILEQICYSNYLPANVTVEIYRLSEGYANPTDGELLTSFESRDEFSGTHTVEVPENVELKAGELFSVVLKSEDVFNINFKYTGDIILENKSFVSVDGSWEDVADRYGLGYVSIKAYTSNKDNAVYKDELSSLIYKAENTEFNENIPEALMENLNLSIANAKEVLNDEAATQNKVDNTLCLLNNAMDKCENAYFEINSMSDFLNFYEKAENGMYSDAQVVLNTDLDFSGETISEPLFANGAFTGEFDGNGHILSNLFLNNYSSCGLFNKLKDATVKNLNLKNCSFNSTTNTGTIAGTAENSTISNCTVTGTEVINAQDFAGGIAGVAERLSIYDCKVENSKIISKSSMAGGIAGSIYASALYNCSITGTEITALSGITLFAPEEVYDCVYDNITLKAFDRIRFNPFCTIINISDSTDCYSMLVFENGKLRLEPYIGEISDVTSDQTTITKVGEAYEIEFDGSSFAIISTTYKPLYTNNFAFSFDILTNEITLNGYYNYTDETANEVVFPSYIGKLPVVSLDYDFEMDSVAQIESIVLPENLARLNSFVFMGFEYLESVTIPESITNIGYGAFVECNNLKDVYYGGTQEQWNNIRIGEGNHCLKNATIHFAEEESTTAVTEPQETTVVTEPASTATEPQETTVVTEPASTVTEPQETTVVTEPASTVTEPQETSVTTEPASTKTEPLESSTATESATGETTTPQPQFESGDVNKDGKLNIKDATAIQKYLAKLSEFDEVQLILADCNSDGKVNIKDATYIQKKIAKLI